MSIHSLLALELGPMYWLHSQYTFDLALFLKRSMNNNQIALDHNIQTNQLIMLKAICVDSDPVHIFSRINFENVDINIVPEAVDLRLPHIAKMDI